MPELTPAQVDLRRTRIGASEVGALMGRHPWTDPARIFARIMEGPEPARQTAAMAAGHALENAIGHYAADQLGLRLRACSMTYIHPTLPLAASPDFYARDIRTGGPAGLVEVKLSRDWSDWLDGPPPWYEWQVRAQLALTNRPWGYLAALVGTSVQVHRIERDWVMEMDMLNAVEAFDRDHLTPAIPPDTSDERLLLRWKLGAGESIAQDDLERAGDDYAAVVRDRRQLDTIEAKARAAFVTLAALQPATRLILGNGWSAKVDDRGTLRFDVKARQ